jgi:Rrf2 family protein
MLSTTCKYALRSIIFIGIKAVSGKKVNVRQIASELDVPMQFLSKILQIYVKNGILISLRGPQGGFAFKKSPHDVTLFDIITVIDGYDLFDSCVIGTRPCHCKDKEEKKCTLHNEYDKVRSGVEHFFKSQTIGSIAENYEGQEKMYLSL